MGVAVSTRIHFWLQVFVVTVIQSKFCLAEPSVPIEIGKEAVRIKVMDRRGPLGSAGIVLNELGLVLANLRSTINAESGDLESKTLGIKSFRVILRDVDSNTALLLINASASKQQLILPKLIDSELHEGDIIFARYGVMGGSVATIRGSIAFLPGPNDREKSVLLQIPISPGASGAPVFNSEGHFLGIIDGGVDSSNGNFATMNSIQNIATLLSANSEVRASIDRIFGSIKIGHDLDVESNKLLVGNEWKLVQVGDHPITSFFDFALVCCALDKQGMKSLATFQNQQNEYKTIELPVVAAEE
jgi:hypothetical protein